MHEIKLNNIQEAVADLATGAIFFCMRSCEYLKTPEDEFKKTKTLRVRNIRFFSKNNLVELKKTNPDLINEAQIISITFEDQKNREKFDTITLHRNNDEILCPVKSWIRIIQRILNYPRTTEETKVCYFHEKNSTYEITNTIVIKHLRNAAICIGCKELGFSPMEIGTHSIRSGGAMSLCLAKIEHTIIKLIGRWKSDAFLKYIRKQVQDLTTDISSRMIQNEHFRHIPSFNNRIIQFE